MSTTSLQPTPECPYCGYLHTVSRCPRIASIEYYPDGRIKRVTFVQAAPPPLSVPGPVVFYTADAPSNSR